MFGKARKLVGVDIGSSALKAVELKKRKGGFVLVSLGFEPLPPDIVGEGAIRDVTAAAGAIERLFAEQKIGARDVVTSIAGHAVIVRHLAAPALDQAEMSAWVQSVAAEHVPFDPGDVRLSYHLFDGPRNAGDRHCSLVAAKKEKVDSHSEAIRRAERNPVVMDIDCFALANCFEANYQPNPAETVALIDLGASLANVVVLRDGLPVFTRDVPVGGLQFTEALQREFSLDYEEAERVKRGESAAVPPDQLSLVAQSFVEMVIEEIGRTFDFFRSGAERTSAYPSASAPAAPQAEAPDPIGRIYVTGGVSLIPNFTEHLFRRFSVPVKEFDPLRQVEIPSDRFDHDSVRRLAPLLAVSVGLALRSGEPA